MGETLKTAGFVAAALVAVSTAVVIQPANFAPRIMSDQGQLFLQFFPSPDAVIDMYRDRPTRRDGRQCGEKRGRIGAARIGHRYLDARTQASLGQELEEYGFDPAASSSHG